MRQAARGLLKTEQAHLERWPATESTMSISSTNSKNFDPSSILGTAKSGKLPKPLSAKSAQSPEDILKQYADMSPGDRMRANILASMGLTEDDLKGMDSKQLQAVEDKIAQQLKQAVEKQTDKKAGVLTDISV
jgi:hypothetical protein